jgi:hypothetical protein
MKKDVDVGLLGRYQRFGKHVFSVFMVELSFSPEDEDSMLPKTLASTYRPLRKTNIDILGSINRPTHPKHPWGW